MQTTPQGWTVIDADAGVLTRSYSYAKEGRSNCLTAKLPSGGLMILSAPSRIDPAAVDELAEYGPVEAIVANNGFHYLGLARWHELFPQARCFAAQGAIDRIQAKSKRPVPTIEPLSALGPLLGPDVAVIETASSKCGETWARVKIAGGYAWFASDILINMDSLPAGFVVRTLFRLTKSAPGYRVFGLAAKFILKDRRASLAGMLADVKAHPPTVMVPAHGELVTRESCASETAALLEAAL
jgi:hypothetical protein